MPPAETVRNGAHIRRTVASWRRLSRAAEANAAGGRKRRCDNGWTADVSGHLQSKIVRFSHHAETRLQQRGIKLGPDQLAKIGSAIDKAASKGAKDSLMLLGGTALIVNVPNRTVVTALDGASMQEHVFTQIDSAVIIS
ncbi:TIGR02530 family flagellar biosynthesis protein [Gordoniibacillus kamchatkensis]|uniref:TIGR02530 family flagellar biosynthesis protein n=1 Tax=Gordoniibacillus kamchatkensis TaxID=1590651 RepID=UPI000ADDE6D2|nr:TIGR02530 family flagellar biosynthesis protein [Paenibacillus sp. VKM B-2647]